MGLFFAREEITNEEPFACVKFQHGTTMGAFRGLSGQGDTAKSVVYCS